MSKKKTAAALTDYQAALPTVDTTPLAVDQVSLSWSDTTGSETGFRVERCTGSGCATSFTAMDSVVVAANATSYVDRAVAAATTYCYRVKAILAAGDTAASDPPQCVATSTPLAPANLQTAVTGTRVDLSWSDPTTNEEGFQVERCTGSGCDFTTPDSGFPALLSANATATGSFSDNTACTGTTYRYRVKSIKPWVAGWPADYAASPDVTTASPGAPDGLAAARVSEVQVNLTWVNHTPDATGYRVERSTDGVNFVATGADLGATTASFSDTGLAPNTTYTYRIHAFKSGGACVWDTWSTTATATTSVAAPAGLTAVAASTTQVNLAWTDTTASETGFEIARCTGAGCADFAPVASVGPNVTAYQDSSVAKGGSYTYQVRASNAGVPWESAYSAIATAATPVPGTPVLTATRGSESRVTLAWSDPLTDETGYRVERSIDGTNFTPVGADLAANTTGYSDTSAVAATTYTYRVRGFKTAANPWETVSNTASVTTTINVPTGLTATAANTTQVNLVWNRTTEGETGFKVERCQGSGCGDFSEIAYLPTPATATVAYADTTAGNGTSYSYRVRAANTAVPWDSGYSNTASATTPVPVAPGAFTAVVTTDTEIALAWTDPNPDESGVKVERCSGADCTGFVEVSSLPASTRAYNDTGLAPSTTYCYRTRAYKEATSGWYTAYTPVACGQTGSARPTTLTATAVNAFKIRLDWTDNASDEEGYEVETQVWNGRRTRAATDGANVRT